MVAALNVLTGLSCALTIVLASSKRYTIVQYIGTSTITTTPNEPQLRGLTSYLTASESRGPAAAFLLQVLAEVWPVLLLYGCAGVVVLCRYDGEPGAEPVHAAALRAVLRGQGPLVPHQRDLPPAGETTTPFTGETAAVVAIAQMPSAPCQCPRACLSA